MASFCLDTHLNSPLSVTILHECLDLITQKKKFPRNVSVKNKTEELTALLHTLKLPIDYDFRTCPQEVTGLLTDLVDEIKPSSSTLKEWTEIYQSCCSFTPEHLTKLSNGWDRDQIAEKLSQVENHPDIQFFKNLYHMRRFFEAGVCLTAKPDRKRGPIPLEWSDWTELTDSNGDFLGYRGELNPTNGVFFLTKSHMVWYTEAGVYIATRQHFLLFSDIISQRSICMFSVILAELFGKVNYPTSVDIKALFMIGDKLLSKFGNEAYNTLSLWEPLVNSEVLSRKEDKAVDSESFKRSIQTAFIESQGPENENYLRGILEDVIAPWLRGLDIHLIFQLFGLYRIWGHPNVNEIEAVKKLRSVACRSRVVNKSLIMTMKCKWREYFCLNYYSKNKQWPQMEISPLAPNSPLINALRDGTDITILTPGYKLSDWNYITFKKTFDIPEKFELSEMISDKATSFNIDELREACQKDGNIGASYKRSVIIKWLDTNYNNPQEFLDKIDREGFDPKESCVGVHPKERELKVFARLFGLLTIEKRLYVVVTEALLADYIFPYFPEITMTFDSVTLQTRIHANTSKQSNKKKEKYHTVIVNMDFNKWNSYMREEETKDLFKDFDNLFGFNNVFGRTHEMFKNQMMYLADGTITPFDKDGNLIQSEGIWFDHLGGIEGLRQKGWTIFTVVLLKYIAEVNDIKCQIMGQGDNQVLILDYPIDDPRPLRERHEQFLEELNGVLKHIGPPLKMEETWSSSHFFIYGKFPVYLGKPKSMSLKKLCRTMRLTNEGFQNLESTLSSITANASAATGSDNDPIIPYIIGTLESLGAIRLNLMFPFYKSTAIQLPKKPTFKIPREGTSVDMPLVLTDYDTGIINRRHPLLLSVIANYPCILGGYPSLQLCDLMLHGFHDPLSLNIWSLFHFIKSFPQHPLVKYMLNMLNPNYNPVANYELICQDPTSINLIHSSSGNEKIKRLVFDFLTGEMQVNNQVFLTFLKLAKKRQTDLSNILSSMTPLNPRIANSILASTIVGRAMKIVSKINKTNVIIRLMAKNYEGSSQRDIEEILNTYDMSSMKAKSLSDSFGKFEENYLYSVLYGVFHVGRTVRLVSQDSCSREWAQRLRDESWGKVITGVTVAVPAEFLQWLPTTGEDCTLQNHPYPEIGYISVITELPQRNLRSPEFDPYSLGLGPFKPFFGAATKNKVQYEGGEIKRTAPPLMRGALDMLCLIGWGTEKDSNLSALLRAIFSSFTDLDPDVCIPEDSMISGSVEHRWQDMRTSHYSSLSILYELVTHITVNTNNFKPQNLPQNIMTDNYNVSFQTIFTWIGSQWVGRLISNPHTIESCFHLHLNCPECIQPIYEQKLDIDDPQSVIDSLQADIQVNNPYCWVPRERLIAGNKLELATLFPKVSPEQSNLDPERLLTIALTSYYLVEFPFSLTENLKLKETSKIIPISVALKVNIRDFVLMISIHRLLHYYYIRSPTLVHQGCNASRLFLEGLTVLNDTPNSWYKGMVSLLLNYSALSDLREDLPSLELPRGTPPSMEEKCHFFKRLSYSICSKELSLPKFIKHLDYILSEDVFSTHLVTFNPIIIKLIRNMFSLDPREGMINLEMLASLRLLICSKRSSFIIHSNGDLYKLALINEDSLKRHWLLPQLKRERESLMPVHNVSALIDHVASSLGSRKNVIDVSQPSGQDIYSNVQIFLETANLPQGASLIISNHNAIPYKEDALECVLVQPKVRSLRNHIYKTDNPITTASYKPLSILVELNRFLDLREWDDPDITIGCVGDGVGGYSTMCGRIFVKSKIFYNTLFELEKLSSVGVDYYIPASIGMFPSIFKRLHQLPFTTEKMSDLTNSDFPLCVSPSLTSLKMLICDAEGGGWEDPGKGLKIVLNLCRLMQLVKGDLLIVKSYASRLDLLYSQFCIMGLNFRDVYIYRSHFSSIGNTEVFLVGSILKHNPQSPQIFIQHDPHKKESLIRWKNQSLVLSFNVFKTRFQDLLFQHNVKDIAPFYSRVLRIPEWKDEVLSELNNFVEELSLDGRQVIFPLDLIYKWRREFNFVKFSQQKTSHFKINFISDNVMKKLAYEFMLIYSVLFPDEEFERFEYILMNHFFIIYGTIDGSWAVQVTSNIRGSGWLTKIKLLKDCLGPSKIKELLVNVGRMKEIVDLRPIKFLNSISNPKVFTPDQIKEWWKEIGETCYPVSFIPLHQGEFDPATSRFKPRVITLKIPLGKKEERKAMMELGKVEEVLEKGEIILEQSNKKYLFKKEKIQIQLTREKIRAQKTLTRALRLTGMNEFRSVD